jgi:hypothetical protein
VVEVPDSHDKLAVIVERDGEKTITETPLPSPPIKLVVVINNQITDSPNTTQIASGAGLNSAAGSNAAIDSSNTLQQQTVGGAGEADNSGMNGKQEESHTKPDHGGRGLEVVIVLNNQINRAGSTAAATQVASGGGLDSASGTNSVIGSSNSKQQHAVGGSEGGSASNAGMDDSQREVDGRQHREHDQGHDGKDEDASCSPLPPPCDQDGHEESHKPNKAGRDEQHHKRQEREWRKGKHERKRRPESRR